MSPISRPRQFLVDECSQQPRHGATVPEANFVLGCVRFIFGLDIIYHQGSRQAGGSRDALPHTQPMMERGRQLHLLSPVVSGAVCAVAGGGNEAASCLVSLPMVGTANGRKR